MPIAIRLAPQAIAFFCCVALASGQTSLEKSSPSNDTQLLSQVQDLRTALEQLRGELADTRRESQALRREIEAMRQQLAGSPAAQPPASLTEDLQVTDSKLSDLYQTKVASGSKYHLTLSGIALFNAASTRGTVDQIDLPSQAQRGAPGGPSGSLGATVRQSQITLEVFGPEWHGAKTAGDLTVDFFGGFPSTPEGVSTGLLRLRTAKVTLDWKNASIIAGQDAPFFSPRSPTSLASLAYPAFSSTGNLWTWTPQVAFERRWNVSEQSRLSITGGVLDPLTGELPAAEYDRLPTAGERSRIPAYAARFAWERTAYGDSASLGAGSYYSRQNWQAGQTVDSWAATTDWNLPLGPKFWLSGEAYRGRAIGGLGGGPNGSILQTGLTRVTPIDSAGGWLQLKFTPAPKIELNGVFGEDHAFLSRFVLVPGSLPALPVNRNASGMFNVIYHPRSNLVLSAEYRRLRTVRPSGPATADHVNLAAGIIF